tara:strand:- start:84 stop:845 length:762 start_codon:yes stop_codon:yes gene_type:complete
MFFSKELFSNPGKANLFTAILLGLLLLVPISFFSTYPGFETKKSELVSKCLSDLKEYRDSGGTRGKAIRVKGFTTIDACYGQAALDADPPWFEWFLLIGGVMGLWIFFVLPWVDTFIWSRSSSDSTAYDPEKAEKEFQKELKDKPGKWVKLGQDHWEFSGVLSSAKNLLKSKYYADGENPFYHIDNVHLGLRAAKLYLKSYKFNKTVKRSELVSEILEKIVESSKKSPKRDKPNFSKSYSTAKELIKKFKDLK